MHCITDVQALATGTGLWGQLREGAMESATRERQLQGVMRAFLLLLLLLVCSYHSSSVAVMVRECAWQVCAASGTVAARSVT